MLALGVSLAHVVSVGLSAVACTKRLVGVLFCVSRCLVLSGMPHSRVPRSCFQAHAVERILSVPPRFLRELNARSRTRAFVLCMFLPSMR